MRALVLGLALLAASDQLVYASCSTDSECEAIEARVSFTSPPARVPLKWLRDETAFCQVLIEGEIDPSEGDWVEYARCSRLVWGPRS